MMVIPSEYSVIVILLVVDSSEGSKVIEREYLRDGES